MLFPGKGGVQLYALMPGKEFGLSAHERKECQTQAFAMHLSNKETR